MRVHLLGLSHTRTTRAYSVCAFTQKVRLLSRMLHDGGHTVYHYGVAGSTPVCTEHISVVDDATFAADHETYDYRTAGFLLSRETASYTMFAARAVAAIRERIQPQDFLLCPFGLDHAPIAQAFPQAIVVESGIGYEHTFAPHRVFESYAWMHYHYGKEAKGLAPNWYDAVIPNALDPDDFPFSERKQDYFLFLGRPTELKGRQIAIDVCRALGMPLYVAGQGDRTVPDGVTHLGVLGGEDRAWWLGHARGLFAPTYYIEPFGTVAIEALACGTPVICTDMGAFTETVPHGQVGYRCRTFEQFLWAAANIGTIRPHACRSWAAQYFLPAVARRYEEYLHMLQVLHTSPEGWYTRQPDRTNLEWLNQF